MVLWKLKFTKSHDYLILKVISSLALMHKDLPWAHYYNFIFTIFLKNIQAVLPHDKIKVGDMSGASFTIKSKSEVLTSSQLSIIPSVIANLLDLLDDRILLLLALGSNKNWKQTGCYYQLSNDLTSPEI